MERKIENLNTFKYFIENRMFISGSPLHLWKLIELVLYFLIPFKDYVIERESESASVQRGESQKNLHLFDQYVFLAPCFVLFYFVKRSKVT